MADVPAVGRSVSLVLARADEPARVVATFDVESPWWQDVAPITAKFPGIVVLRLLEVRAPPDATSGGHVSYLVEPLDAEGESDAGVLVAWEGVLGDHPLRMPWAVPGGPGRDVAWASAHGARGSCVQHRTWNLSSIWSFEHADGTSWLKCVPRFFAHEATILELLAGHAVPSVLAAEGHRLLLDELPGIDGYEATYDEHVALIDVLVELQCSTIGRRDELLGRGVPDRRFPRLIGLITDVIARRAPTSGVLARFLETSGDRVAELAACGLPDVLVHGDAHPGNARIGRGAGSGIWFDWGDATIGHPLLDLGVLDRPGFAHREALRAHWLDAWGRAAPTSDPHRAWQLVRPLAPLVGAVTYQGFLDLIEPSERIYHEADVPRCLAEAERLLAE